MDWTDVHYRQLARLISRRTWLWTEMVVDKTILHTPFLDKFLWFPPEQRPLVLQLGGSDPRTLAEAAVKARARERGAAKGFSGRAAGGAAHGAAPPRRPAPACCCRPPRSRASHPIGPRNRRAQSHPPGGALWL